MRPVCKKCGKQCTTIGTRVSGEDRVRYLGCRYCSYRAPGVEIVRSSTDGRFRNSKLQSVASGLTK